LSLNQWSLLPLYTNNDGTFKITRIKMKNYFIKMNYG
jgi:hypothetical protein